MVGEPVRLSGGFMHKMYKINTQQGTFVLKLLNPFVMQRETAMDNFAKAERIELLLEQEGIPVLPASACNPLSRFEKIFLSPASLVLPFPG